jgi:NADPH:quinone reductase-like Zn-dependent oxidoreductase
MRGLIVEKPAAPFVLVEDLPKPKPGANQMLIKSIYTGINPV